MVFIRIGGIIVICRRFFCPYLSDKSAFILIDFKIFSVEIPYFSIQSDIDKYGKSIRDCNKKTRDNLLSVYPSSSFFVIRLKHLTN